MTRCRHHTPREGRVSRYLKARLQRRLFVTFGITIMATVAMVAAAMSLLDGGWGASFRLEVRRVEALIDRQFAQVWGTPAARDGLARAVAEELDASVMLLDDREQTLVSHGPACGTRTYRVPVQSDGTALGSVVVCFHRFRHGGPFRVALVLGVIASVLWAASGLISRRLARPLLELSRVAREIGEGNLQSRVRLDRRAAGEVGVVGETLNDMAARIEKQLADQRELLAAVSHELRTPLSRIRLLTEMARDRGRGGEESEGVEIEGVEIEGETRPLRVPSSKLLDDLDREVMEIDALVGDLLASSRIDFNALTVTRVAPADAALRALERAGLDPSLLEVEEDTPPAMEVDATLLGRALANLIENARAHGGGVERLRVHARGETISFDVEDGGLGFSPGEEARVFEPFYRGGSASASEPRGALGLGLGLALCKRIAVAHGGRAFAENRAEGGARVGVEIRVRPPSSGGAPRERRSSHA
ncbi:HAMP domain-containing sensor histidine kinase [Chondromyces crocatus]|uniref:histidine kinase n=1 Tax=Chondromyces crocatus TaxID=52 RepID=A0A0K1EFD6_CHOCO|nr:HAMP domain-containing sensor histidine kinase [Chondromyces crocatus]AKT39417.1 histidine kinase [Chondromyces crocatus]